MKDKLGEKIMKEFVRLRPKTYSYLKCTRSKKGAIKRSFKFENYKKCLEVN